MPNIEPLYIAIFIAIVIGVVWYFQHKKDKHAQEVGDNLLKKAAGDKRNAGALSDNASVDEESVPVLTAADEDPEAAAGAAAAVSTQPLEETGCVPGCPARADRPAPQAGSGSGGRSRDQHHAA